MQKSKGLKKVVTGLNGLNEKEMSMKGKEIKMRRMNSLNELYDIETVISTTIAETFGHSHLSCKNITNCRNITGPKPCSKIDMEGI